MLKVLDNDGATEEQAAGPTLDELAREGARRMLLKALAVEVAQYVDTHAEAQDEHGRRLVVRNGQARARKVTCGAGTLEVRAAAGERQAGGGGRSAPAVHKSHSAAVYAPLAAGGRGAADSLSARAVDRRFS